MNGIKIHRINHFRFGKDSLVGRLLAITSFNLLILVRLLFGNVSQYDAILGLTNPPLVSFFGVLIAKFSRVPFHLWAMDLQPEISFRLGFLKRRSLSSRLLSWMSRFVFQNASHVIALDGFMEEFVRKELRAKRTSVIPVWSASMNEPVYNKSENSFRLQHGLEGKIVIMYSGNHTIAHPLATLLDAAKQLKNDPRFHFVFVGEGNRKSEVDDAKRQHQLANVLALPSQDRSKIHISLSAADLQVVVLGDELVGLTHPSKIYTAMKMGIPILYIGPKPSHVFDLISQIPENIVSEHGNHADLVSRIERFADLSAEVTDLTGKMNRQVIEEEFAAELSLSLFRRKLSAKNHCPSGH